MPHRLIPLLLGSLIVLNCTGNGKTMNAEENGMKTLTGTVWYRERMLLPPTATIRVTLADVAKMDAPSDVIAYTDLQSKGGPPWPYVLTYDPARLQPQGRYALRARIEDRDCLIFTNTTHIPAFESEPGQPIDIMVTRTAGHALSNSQKASQTAVEITGNNWQLVELNSKPVALGAGKRDMHMVVSPDGSQVHGFSGCNRFSGSVDLQGDRLEFKQMMSTMMACIDGGDLERDFLEALQAIRNYAINGEELTLSGENGTPLLKFNLVNLR